MGHWFAARMLNRPRANFTGIKAAPEAFLLLMIITIGACYFVFERSQRERLAALENKIGERDRLMHAGNQQAAGHGDVDTAILGRADIEHVVREIVGRRQLQRIDACPHAPGRLAAT